MWQDPIVEEVRRARAEFAQKHNNDLHAMCEAIRKEQEESGRKVVSRPPRKPTFQNIP